MVTGSPFTLNDPARPGCPPNTPWGASVSRLVTALSCQGLDVATSNSMTWPRPPGWAPDPPEPGRSDLRRNRTGADASTTSRGTAETPVG